MRIESVLGTKYVAWSWAHGSQCMLGVSCLVEGTLKAMMAWCWGFGRVKWAGPPPRPSFWTVVTQLSVPFSQVRMQTQTLDGPPRGPRLSGITEPMRALGRCWSPKGPS